MKIFQTGSALRSSLISIAAIVALLAFFATQLPKGYKDDLNRIGQGTGTAVLVHNKNGVQSLDLMHLVDKVRADFEGQVEFLIADVDTDSGKKFMQAQQVGNTALVLFAPDGKRLRVIDAALDEEALRLALGSTFTPPR